MEGGGNTVFVEQSTTDKVANGLTECPLPNSIL